MLGKEKQRKGNQSVKKIRKQLRRQEGLGRGKLEDSFLWIREKKKKNGRKKGSDNGRSMKGKEENEGTGGKKKERPPPILSEKH